MSASETPAAHLARMKTEFPSWTWWRGTSTNEFWAAPPKDYPHQELLSAATVGELEVMVRDAESWRRQ